ncbi:MAG: UDP-N-acetylmuramoyl-tripeptide--D-alanyl-D-alanine ligase [Propionibacteriales bacterium]|nr:UDP-N-acetylmuramoyl-tripeptide--D-alanyl-D-alanine ligase [Propionibacteriales bacterium]
MIPMTLNEIAAVVGGETHGDRDVVVSGPAFVDSRTPRAGGLFVAVAGEHADGHDYAADAVRSGGSAVLASRPVDAPCVVVDDPVEALGSLAAHVVAQLPECRVVAITGSQGKTGTKDLVAQILEQAGPTIAPRESFNNELGVPLTALEADRSTRHLVIEMGARGHGHIGYLAGIVEPDVGAVLNIGIAHLGEFGSRDDIARAKGELVQALPADGLAVLNADDDLVVGMRALTETRVLTFGRARPADVSVSDLALDRLARPRFRLSLPDGAVDVALPLVGEHQAANAVAAAAVAHGCGVGSETIAYALNHAEPRSPWRMEVHERADGVTVVNDAYNANPDSVRAALHTLVALGGGERRTVAVLGEMKELGAAAAEEHTAVGRQAARLGVARLLVVEEGARAIHTGAELEGYRNGESVFVPDVDAAIERLREDVGVGDVVLVKASRAAGFERIAEALLTHPVRDPERLGS